MGHRLRELCRDGGAMRAAESIFAAMVRAIVLCAFVAWLAVWMAHAGYASW